MAGHRPTDGERGGPAHPPWLAPGDGGDQWRRTHRRLGDDEAASRPSARDDVPDQPPPQTSAPRHAEPDPGPPFATEDSPVADEEDVDARAARLADQMAARRAQSQPAPSRAEPEVSPPQHLSEEPVTYQESEPPWEPQYDAPPQPVYPPQPPMPPQPGPPGWPDPYGHDGFPPPPPPGPWFYPPPPPGWMPPPGPGGPPMHVEPPPPQAFWAAPALDRPGRVDRPEEVPQRGWRKALHKVTKGQINPGVSRRERERSDLLDQIRQPFTGDFRIAVLSIKGGVGKTTTTLGLGSALAMVRGDRVIAVDANPDRGTLAERVQDASTSSTVRDLLRDKDVHRYADVRKHTRMAISRLEVLASEQDPAVAEVFSEGDYRQTIDILRHYYNIVLTDCGTGIMHSAMSGVLDLAHTIVLVSSPAIDAARSASATLDWLQQHGHGGLVRDAHVVFSASRPGSAEVRMDRIREHFEARCRSIHVIPFDQHLAEGAEIDFALLDPGTMQAYLGLAGAVAEKFTRLRSPLDGR